MSEQKMKLNVGVRIFERSEENMTLFWNLPGLTDEQKNHVELSVKTRDLFLSLKFETVTPTELGMTKEVGIAVINHAENKLDPEKQYLLRAVFGIKDPIEVVFEVFPVGVLPDKERDMKKQNVHLFGWEPTKRRWVKIPVVKCKDGSYALAMKLVE